MLNIILQAAEINDELLKEIQGQLYDSVELAERVSLGGLLGCSILILLGIIGCFIVTCQNKGDKTQRTQSERSTKEGSISKESLARTESNSSDGTIISSKSQQTMTSSNKGTMTEGKKGNNRRISLYEPYAYISTGDEIKEKVSKI